MEDCSLFPNVNNVIPIPTISPRVGKYEEAESLYRHTLKRQIRVLGPRRLASMNNLALVLQDLSKYEEAEAI